MPDFLDVLAQTAKETIRAGYYEQLPHAGTYTAASLKKAIIQAKKVAIVTEVKTASPSKCIIRKNVSPKKIATAMAHGGAVGISVLTEPKYFQGSLNNLAQVRDAVKLPVLMKDFILDTKQLDAAHKLGANVVLLIQALFDRGYSENSLNEMIAQAHARNLEVLLETHTENEFQRAMQSDADLVGINNRNLGTLKVDLKVTQNILGSTKSRRKIVMSESGISTAADIRLLLACGAQAFLVGSAVMQSDDVKSKVKELVNLKEA
ncbi:MAG: indole-3-glycerol-phosphate synthase [Candidatus Bathyarchaeota archaeon]|nr:indole-3-glycerol-phosphate synthase [Candidatus Bathyarchaeota archaeon]